MSPIQYRKRRANHKPISIMPDRSVRFDDNSAAELQASNGDYYLFAIAIDEYDEAEVEHKFRPLNNAVYDAASVVEILIDKYNFYTPTEAETEVLNGKTTYSGKPICAYNSLKTKCLYNQNATSDNIILHLDKLCNNMGEHDNLLIYFAGHGVTRNNQNAYIIPYDAINQPLKHRTWFPLAEFADTFDNYLTNRIAQRLLLIVDACYSGDAVLGRQGNNSPEPFSRYVLTSTSADQVADDGEAGEGSPFAQAFLRFLDENTKPFIAIDKGEIADNLDRITMGDSEQEITHLPLPSNQNGSGNFIFELKEKEKPDLSKLAHCLVNHLNFNRQKGDLDNYLDEGESEDLLLFSTLGYSHDAQKFLVRVLLHRLKGLGYQFPNDFLVINLELALTGDTQVDNLWLLLCKNVAITATPPTARSLFMDWIVNKITRSPQSNLQRPLVIWLGYETGTPDLTRNLMELWREFTSLFAQKRQQLEIEEHFDKVFFVLADERDGRLHLTQEDFVDSIGPYPKIVVTDEIKQLTKTHLKRWIDRGKENIKVQHIQALEESYFFPLDGSIKKYKLLPFVRKLSEHCELNQTEINTLENLLTDFKNPLF